METEYRLRKIVKDHYNGFNVGISFNFNCNRITIDWLVDDRCSRYDDYTSYSANLPIDYMDQEGSDDEVARLIDKSVVIIEQSIGQHMSGISGIGLSNK